jgi:hypothetical protein
MPLLISIYCFLHRILVQGCVKENRKGNIRIKQTAASVIELYFFVVRDLTIFRTKVCCAHLTYLCSGKIKIHPHVEGILRCERRNCKGKFCKSKISTLVARDPLLVWIPVPSTHSAMLGAGSAQDRFRGNDKS